MRLKKKYERILLLILIVIVIVLGLILGTKIRNYQKDSKNNDTNNTNYNKNPTYKEHSNEFKIEKANYLEKYYDRYISYRKLHPEYTDDQIITYVNIGLDNNFYTNMENTDMSDGILVICNKYHTLKKDYVPDLVSMDGYGGGQMQREAAKYFKQMSDDAKLDNISIYNVSGYRSYDTQTYLYNNYVNEDGKEKADTYSARAGTSEHQTGLASDINSVSESFESTEAFKWLSKNAYKYGFILRYPKGKEFITGYMYEPWHYRYVGEDAAKFIYENDITYDEYYATYILK